MFNHNQDDIADISACDVFIIASPNESHTEWIKTIRSLGKDKYIFCEKPPATDQQQLNQVKDFDPKIYFNFNYRHSLLAELIKKYIGNNKIGKVIHATFTSSHGLAFSKAYKDNWRFAGQNLSSSIIGNVGIHYIDLVNYLFGSIKDISITTRKIASNNLPDSSFISINSETCTSSIFISYAAPFRNEAKVIFDDGIVELRNGHITLQSPRDVFDNNKRFVPAAIKTIEPSFNDSKSYYDDSLINSLKYFFSIAKNNKLFSSKSYDKAIITNQIILDKIAISRKT
tara:strand:- start:4214 stop:5068 length:855 start_codon:yes stop_codon:yes gene_type:complete